MAIVYEGATVAHRIYRFSPSLKTGITLCGRTMEPRGGVMTISADSGLPDCAKCAAGPISRIAIRWQKLMRAAESAWRLRVVRHEGD